MISASQSDTENQLDTVDQSGMVNQSDADIMKELDRCWHEAKKTIEHEHLLVSYRITRFLTIQGFLFTVVVAALGGYFYFKSWFFRGLIILTLWTLYYLARKTAEIVTETVMLARTNSYSVSKWFSDKASGNCDRWPNLHAKLSDLHSTDLQNFIKTAYLAENTLQDNTRQESRDSNETEKDQGLFSYLLKLYLRLSDLAKQFLLQPTARDKVIFCVEIISKLCLEIFFGVLDIAMNAARFHGILVKNRFNEHHNKFFPVKKNDEKLRKIQEKLGSTSIHYPRLFHKIWYCFSLCIILPLTFYTIGYACYYHKSFFDGDNYSPFEQYVVEKIDYASANHRDGTNLTIQMPSPSNGPLAENKDHVAKPWLLFWGVMVLLGLVGLAAIIVTYLQFDKQYKIIQQLVSQNKKISGQLKSIVNLSGKRHTTGRSPAMDFRRGGKRVTQEADNKTSCGTPR